VDESGEANAVHNDNFSATPIKGPQNTIKELTALNILNILYIECRKSSSPLGETGTVSGQQEPGHVLSQAWLAPAEAFALDRGTHSAWCNISHIFQLGERSCFSLPAEQA
jgi:hypothetical protein